MAHFIRNLNKRKRGDRILIKTNIKNYQLSLYKKNDSKKFSYDVSKNENHIITVVNYEAQIVIPSSGFWQIAIQSKQNISGLKLIENSFS